MFCVLLSSPSSENKNRSPQNSFSKIKSPKWHAVNTDDSLPSNEPTKKGDLKLRPSAPSVILEDLDLKEYDKSSKRDDKISHTKNIVSPDGSPKKSSKVFDNISDNQVRSFNDIILQHTEEFKQKEANMKGLKKLKGADAKPDETFHRRGRLRMKRPEKIERQSSIQTEGKGLISMQKRTIVSNETDNESEIQIKTHSDKTAEKSSSLSEKVISPERTKAPAILSEKKFEKSPNSRNDDLLSDKKSPTRSEPANMSLRTAPRKSTRLISEIGDEKHTRHDASENRKSPQKSAMSPDSKSPGRPKKSQEDAAPIAKIAKPEEEETDDLMKQKGVTVSKEGKLMIPSQKLSLSEELCKVMCNEKGKKNFVCQICDKVFPRKDKINYHIYSDHHEEFVRLGTGVPQILTKGDILNSSDHSLEDSFEGEVQIQTSFSEPEDLPLESKKKTSKPSNALSNLQTNSVNEQASEKEKPLITSSIKRSPRKKSECNQNDSFSSSTLQAGGKLETDLKTIEVKDDIAHENSSKGTKDTSGSLLTYIQPVENESEHDTVTPVRPRRTSRKGGLVDSSPKESISSEENKTNKNTEKVNKTTSKEITIDASKPTTVVKSVSKNIVDKISPKSEENMRTNDKTMTAKNVKKVTEGNKVMKETDDHTINKPAKDDITPKIKVGVNSKVEEDIKARKNVKAEMESDDEDEDDRKSIEALAYSLSRTHGKLAKRTHRFFDDVGRLIEIQEDVRRLRNRRLYDSNDAVEIMQQYRYVRQKKFSIKRLQEGKNSFKFKIVKEKSEERKIIVSESNPLSFKIVKLAEAGFKADVTKQTHIDTHKSPSNEDNKNNDNGEETCSTVKTANPQNILQGPKQLECKNEKDDDMNLKETSTTESINTKQDNTPLEHISSEQNVDIGQSSLSPPKPKEEQLKTSKRKLDATDVPKQIRQTKPKKENAVLKKKLANKVESGQNDLKEKLQKESEPEPDFKDTAKIKTPEKISPRLQAAPEKSAASIKSDNKGNKDESVKDTVHKQDSRQRKRKASASSEKCKPEKTENGKTETNSNIISAEKECLKIVIRQSDLGASLKTTDVISPKSEVEQNHVVPEYKIQSLGNPLKLKLTTGIKPVNGDNEGKKNHVKKKKKNADERKIKPFKVLKEKIGKEPSNLMEESPIKLVLKLPSQNSSSDISDTTKDVLKKKKAKNPNVVTNKIVIKGFEDIKSTPRKKIKKLKDDIENISLSSGSRKIGIKRGELTGEKTRKVKNEKFLVKSQNPLPSTKEGSDLVELAGKSPPTFVEKKVAKAMQSKNLSIPNDLSNKGNQIADLGTETRKDSRMNSELPKLPEHKSEPAVTFSPDSSPEHGIDDFGTTSGPELLARDASIIGLNEGTFHNVMKFIDGSDEDEYDRSCEGKPSDPSLSLLYDKKENVATSVEKSQVDGGFDSLSSVSYSPDPRRFSLDEPLPFVSDKDTKEGKTDETRANSRQGLPMNVIQKRMTQANKNENKPALLKHVFSTYTKRRRIMVVKYRKPQHKILDLGEYNAIHNGGKLDVDYDEDSTVYSYPKDTPSKAKKTKVEESPSKDSPTKMPLLALGADEMDKMQVKEDSSIPETMANLDCHICKRSFPNRIRLLAHFQMHSDDDAKKKRKKPYDVEPREDLEDFISMKIDQVDGATDIIEPSTSTSSSKDHIVSNETVGQVANTPEQQSTAHVLILRRENEDSSNNALLPNGTIALDHSSVTGSSIYPCPHCNLAFRESLDLETHMTLRHGQGKTSQIVTVIRPSQPSALTTANATLTNNDSSLANGGNITFNQTSNIFESNANSSLGTPLISLPMDPLPPGNQHPFLMKQDPVLMSNDFIKEEEEQEDSHSDFMLDESLQLFESHHSSLIDSSDSAIHLSLDDIASFAQPIVDPTTDGSHTSFDTSIETSSFLSGTESHPLEDILSETTTNAATPVSLPESFPHAESRTPSLPDDGEFPCSQCDKKFGNRRNLLSHTRRHTGDFKLFCDDCGKGFFTQSKLDSHKRKHTGNNLNS